MPIFVFLDSASGDVKVIDGANEPGARLQLPQDWEPSDIQLLTLADVRHKHERAIEAVLNASTTTEREGARARRTRWAHVVACLLDA